MLFSVNYFTYEKSALEQIPYGMDKTLAVTDIPTITGTKASVSGSTNNVVMCCCPFLSHKTNWVSSILYLFSNVFIFN